MPEKASVPAFDKCTSCAFASAKGPVTGPLPTSHTEVCCLYKFSRQGPLCLKEEGEKLTCDGLCEGCPSRLKFRQLQDLVAPLPELGAQSSKEENFDNSVRAAVTAPDSGTPRKGPKIAPRRRQGFKKLTIELRPPKFKMKLWFGTYEPEDVDRAKDAINYYMGSNEPYLLSDSPLIFAQNKLEIEFRELLPSCEQFVQVGVKKIRASVYFARQVKEVIKAVTGKKKGAQRRQKVGKTGAPQKLEFLEKETTSEPVLSCASGLTSSSVIPCASDSTFSSVDDMVWDIPGNTSNVATHGASSEVNSELATVHSSVDELVWNTPGDTSNAVAAYGANSEANSELATGPPSVDDLVWDIPGDTSNEVAAYGANSEANSELATGPPSALPPPCEIQFESEQEILFNWDGETFPRDWITILNAESPSVVEGDHGILEDMGFSFPSLWS